MQWTWDDVQNWEELRPYVDTALLPLYLYQEERTVPEHVKRMSYLMRMATAVEQRLKGRILLFPLAYQTGEARNEWRVPGGFPLYFALRFSGGSMHPVAPEEGAEIESLTISDEDLDSTVRFELTVDILCQTIQKKWHAHR